LRRWLALDQEKKLLWYASNPGQSEAAEIFVDEISGVRSGFDDTNIVAGQSRAQELQFHYIPRRASSSQERSVRTMRLCCQTDAEANDWLVAIGQLQELLQREHLQRPRPQDGNRQRKSTVLQEGVLFEQVTHDDGAADYLRLHFSLFQIGDTGDWLLSYGDSDETSKAGATIPATEIFDVRFGFDRKAPPAADAGGRGRRSCEFQFQLRHGAVDTAPSSETVVRLQALSTQATIDWVHALRQVSGDSQAYPELIDEAILRLLRVVYHRTVKNSDGTARSSELLHELEGEAVLWRVISARRQHEAGRAVLSGLGQKATFDQFAAAVVQFCGPTLTEALAPYLVLTTAEAVAGVRRHFDQHQVCAHTISAFPLATDRWKSGRFSTDKPWRRAYSNTASATPNFSGSWRTCWTSPITPCRSSRPWAKRPP
jgi:hypothetical protein